MIPFVPPAWLLHPATRWLAVAALIPSAFLLGQCDGAAKQKQIDAAIVLKAQEFARKRDAEAKAKAAQERVADTAETAKLEKDLADADQGLPDTRPSDSRLALNCQRLRNQGADLARVPACRGFAERAKARPVG